MPSQEVKGPSNRMPLALESLEERIAPAGSIIATVSGGILTITGDAEANNFIIDDAGLPFDEIRITPNGGTMINGFGGPFEYADITALKINLGDGDDSMSLHGIAIAKNVQINGGTGIDGVTVDQFTTIGGSLSLTDTDFSQIVDATVTGAAKIAYTTDGDYDVHMGRAHVGGNLSIANRGQDMFSVVRIDESTIAGSLAVSNKIGSHGFGDASRVLITDSLVGAVTVKGGTGDYDFDFINSQTTQPKGGISLAYGVGDLSALIDGSLVHGSVSMKTGGGLPAMAYDTDFTLRNGADIHGKLTIKTFDTDDTFVVDDAVVVKGFNISVGTGDFMASISEFGAGGERMINGKLKAYPSTIAQSTSGWSFSTDTTNISFHMCEIGGLAVKLRAQASNVSFNEAGIFGNLSVTSQGGDDIVTLYKMRIDGNVTLKTGGGDDRISLNWIEHDAGTLSIDAGAGNDLVALDTQGENRVSSYDGPVKISLGAGDDALFLGSPLVNGNSGQYTKAVTLNGGAGNDELVYFNGGNTFTVAPKITLFENIH